MRTHNMITSILFQALLNQMQKEFVIRHDGCGLSFLYRLGNLQVVLTTRFFYF